MSSPVFHKRRAERLATLLDEAAGGRRHHRRTALDDTLGGYVGLAGRLGSASAGAEPEPEFRDSLRAMLIATIEREGIGVTATEKAARAANRAALAGKTQVVKPVRTRGGRARAAVLVGVTAGALALSGVSMASDNALPGEPLYQVKLSSERAQLALSGSEESRGQRYLVIAADRLSEAGRVDAGVTVLLADMDKATEEGVSRVLAAAAQRQDASLLDGLLKFVARQRDGLRTLAPELDGADARRLNGSTALLAEVKEQIEEQRTAILDKAS